MDGARKKNKKKDQYADNNNNNQYNQQQQQNNNQQYNQNQDKKPTYGNDNKQPDPYKPEIGEDACWHCDQPTLELCKEKGMVKNCRSVNEGGNVCMIEMRE